MYTSILLRGLLVTKMLKANVGFVVRIDIITYIESSL